MARTPTWPLMPAATKASLKVRSGFVVDVLHPCNANAPNWVNAGVVQPIDTSKLSHWDDVIPSMKTIAAADGETYFARYGLGPDLGHLSNGPRRFP